MKKTSRLFKNGSPASYLLLGWGRHGQQAQQILRPMEGGGSAHGERAEGVKVACGTVPLNLSPNLHVHRVPLNPGASQNPGSDT